MGIILYNNTISYAKLGGSSMSLKKKLKILELDPYLEPYKKDILLRTELYNKKRKELLGNSKKLSDFANGYNYFGFHRTATGWVYREWAPAADRMYLTGDFNNWDISSHPINRLDNGVFEIVLNGSDALKAGQKIQAIVINGDKTLRRIPTYATKVVQDSETYLWCAELEEPDSDFKWTDKKFKFSGTPFIYECHIGMSSEEGKVSTYREFKDNVLPRIKELGYNVIQIMAIMEHPYYGSFGYQVSNFFARVMAVAMI